MNKALINETEKKQRKSLNLLNKVRSQIENSILSKSRVIIAMENVFSYCRNCCNIDEVEVYDGGIMIASGNFEVCFKVNDTTECSFDEDNSIFDFKTNSECLHIEFL